MDLDDDHNAFPAAALDDDVVVAPASPLRENQRFDWEQWEFSPMRKLREAGDGLVIVKEEGEEKVQLVAEVKKNSSCV